MEVNNKMRKAIILIAVLALMASIPAPLAFANEEVLFKTQVGVGYWDIWRHADGVTWQYTGKPGDEKSYEFTISQSQPPEGSNYDNIRFEMVPGITKNDFIAAGGRPGYSPDHDGWEKIQFEQLGKKPDNYNKTGDTQVTFTLSPTFNAELIKKQEQADMVEGWRWYLPATVYWYGVPKTEKPLKAGGFYNIDDYLGLKSGDFRTFTYNHEKLGGGEVTFKIYKFTTEIGNVISQHQMPPDAELWKTETVNFRGGWDKWTIDLPVRYPEHGEELGYYITSSETGFSRGVVVSAAADHEVHILNRGSNRDNWHAGDDYVGFFTHEGQVHDLKTKEVQRYIDRWNTSMRHVWE